MKKFLKTNITVVTIGVIALLTVITGLWTQAETNLADTWFHIRGPQDPGSDVAIVAIDEKSIGELGALPWKRDIYAGLLARLDNARVVGFDILFDTHTDDMQDRSFADAVKKQGRVVLASMFTFEQDGGGDWYQRLLKPIPELCDAAMGTGFINMPADKNIVRAAALFDANTYATPYPSLSLAVLMAAQGNKAGDIKVSGNLLSLDNRFIHIYNSNQALIDFWGAGGSFPTYSLSDVLNGRIPAVNFKDKIVLVGTATPTMKGDYYDNPFTGKNLILKGSLPVPGVEIHASAIETYITGRSFYKAPDPVNALILFLAFIAAVYITKKSPRLLGFPFIVLFIFSLGCISYFIWYRFHIVLNAAAPASTAFLVFIAVTAENLLHSEIERYNTRKMFSRYVSPAVVDKLLTREAYRINRGTLQQVTVLFADLRNFTRFCESRTPQEVVARLNYYFSEMTEIIFRHGGTLDKYIGDCIMAVFGAPVESGSHARDAVRAAVEMETRMREINSLLTKGGEEPMDIGIGINSGPVIAGSVGSNVRQEYTVIGDTVNLASRLEAISKEYPSGIILGRNTADLLKDTETAGWVVSALGERSVRGLSKPVEIFLLSKTDESVRTCPKETGGTAIEAEESV